MYEKLNLSLRSNFLFRSIYYYFHDISTFKTNTSNNKNIKNDAKTVTQHQKSFLRVFLRSSNFESL